MATTRTQILKARQLLSDIREEAGHPDAYLPDYLLHAIEAFFEVHPEPEDAPDLRLARVDILRWRNIARLAFLEGHGTRDEGDADSAWGDSTIRWLLDDGS